MAIHRTGRERHGVGSYLKHDTQITGSTITYRFHSLLAGTALVALEERHRIGQLGLRGVVLFAVGLFLRDCRWEVLVKVCGRLLVR